MTSKRCVLRVCGGGGSRAAAGVTRPAPIWVSRCRPAPAPPPAAAFVFGVGAAQASWERRGLRAAAWDCCGLRGAAVPCRCHGLPGAAPPLFENPPERAAVC